jgi:serine/threonine protein kinase
MEVLSPRSANVPTKQRTEMKKTKEGRKPKPDEKPTNPDRIDDKWRPPSNVTEPGDDGETYSVGRKLGKGGFAVCFEGISRKDSKRYALKVVKAKVEQKKMMEKFRTELQIHAKMQHPNIVEFLRAFTHDNHTYVILELCSNGSLTDMVKARGSLSLPEVRRFMIQVCGGVRYLHKRSVIHRDLKMGNIFIDGQMDLKIGDFGLAAVMADEHDRRTTLCGTPNYIAPEILSKSGTRGHDNKVDTWAVGVICYAMLVGTPPFQSKSQQEIYAKLRTLEYEWKIDCKNYIPQQAKDFVASCLNLVSADRPEMDDLVEHEFFTMGVVADTLEHACLKNKPEWLLNADPRGDKVRPGYGITHSQICRAAGVGRGVDGRPRPGVGAKSSISTLVEIEAENRQGYAPTVPLAEGILYSAFTEAHAEWALRQKYPIQPAKPRSRKPVTGQAERDVDDAVLAGIPTMAPPPIPHATRNVPSFAAQQRRQALPSRPAPRQVATKDLESLKMIEEPTSTPATSEGLLKARPMRAASVRVTRSASAQSTAGAVSMKTLPKSTTLPTLAESQERGVSAKTFQVQGETVPDIPSQLPRPNILMGENATTRPRSALSTESTKNESRALRPTTGNDRRVPAFTESGGIPTNAEDKIDPVSGPSNPFIRQKPRIISASELSSNAVTNLTNTTNLEVMLALKKLEMSLAPGASDVHATGSVRNRRMKARIPYPRVDKWVDYSSRHGISYILTDGTLGMIMRSSDDNLRPSSCVVVRNAQIHTVNRAKGVEHQYVPQGREARDVEFYEQISRLAPMKRLNVPPRKFLLDMKGQSSQTAAANAVQETLVDGELERFKEVALLDKFGKYMNKRYDDTEAETAPASRAEPSEHLIHFYQRVGNVGVWRFADGGMQFNFPDHTKVTIYAEQRPLSRVSEFDADLVHLDPEDAKSLAAHGRLTTDSLERRGLMTLSLKEILSDSLRGFEMDVVKSNEVKEKLSWIRAVVGCWLKEGGLGQMGQEKLGWSGLQERRDDKKVKLQWVTVGRPGGDGDVVSSD